MSVSPACAFFRSTRKLMSLVVRRRTSAERPRTRTWIVVGTSLEISRVGGMLTNSSGSAKPTSEMGSAVYVAHNTQEIARAAIFSHQLGETYFLSQRMIYFRSAA